jgi:CheY-like chemotaxis protein
MVAALLDMQITHTMSATAQIAPTPAGVPVGAMTAKANSGLRLQPEPASAGKKKVLLLEDDPAFKEIMSTFINEHGYSVVAVQNGVEGVHEVLASDFEIILCDMQMPTLPGDMFFRAVERMRPHLCDRFIFMTGYRGNGKAADFITSVNGTVLIKPFHVDDLLELFAFVELRTHLLAA